MFSYIDIQNSTFNLLIQEYDLTLYESYQDLSVTAFGVTQYSSIYLIPNVVMAGDYFSLWIYPMNGKQQNFVYIETDPIAIYFAIDFTPISNTSTQCNCLPEFQRFCSFYSFNETQCEQLPACMWVHNQSSLNPNPSYGSCAPCSNGCYNNNTNGAPQIYYDNRMANYQFQQTSDNVFYYFNTSLNIASQHLVTIGTFRLGLLKATIYGNYDFTNYTYDFALTSLNLTFNSNLHSFFSQSIKKWAFTIQGMIRVDYSNLYNFTILTNKDVQIYIDQKLRFSKPADVIDFQSFSLEMYEHQLLHFEVFISDTENVAEYEGNTNGYFVLMEECGNLNQRLFKPKNIFQLQQIEGSSNTTIKVQSGMFIISLIFVAYAYIENSHSFEVNGTVVPSITSKVFRAGISLYFQLIVKDRVRSIIDYSIVSSTIQEVSGTMITWSQMQLQMIQWNLRSSCSIKIVQMEATIFHISSITQECIMYTFT